MKYDEHSLRALILTIQGGGQNDCCSVSEAAWKVSVGTMATQNWNGKDNKSNIIDCNTVPECFCKHQSHSRWITRAAANAYDAEQTEKDSPQQTNDIVVFDLKKVNSSLGSDSN